METKHTAGPWAWQLFGDCHFLTAQHGMREIIISAIPHPQMKYPVPAMNIKGRLQVIDPNEPNAALIASSPDLLRLLEMIIEARDSAMNTPDLHKVLLNISVAKNYLLEKGLIEKEI